MTQFVTNRYRTVIEKIVSNTDDVRTIFRYSVRDAATGNLIFEGHASDPSEAADTARAHIQYLEESRHSPIAAA